MMPSIASVEKPPIVQQILHPMRVEEVQPIIQRQRERTQIKQVIAPIIQREERAPLISSRQLPGETRPVVYNSPSQEFNTSYQQGLPAPTNTSTVVQIQRVLKQPIIQESVKQNIIEEIYPVVHRDIYQPEIIKETLPVFERVVEPPTLLREERAPFVLNCAPCSTGASNLGNQQFVEMDVKRRY